jgi:hypothetical protein
MKLNELIIGKWYTTGSWSQNSYAKFLEIRDSEFCMSERLLCKEHYKEIYLWSGRGHNFEEVSIEEIRKYLPKDYKFENTMNYYFY